MKTKRVSEVEAARIHFMREKDGTVSFRVFPPASLRNRAHLLPYYGPKGFWLHNWEQLTHWLHSVAEMKLEQ